jgi:hypothetical protein
MGKCLEAQSYELLLLSGEGCNKSSCNLCFGDALGPRNGSCLIRVNSLALKQVFRSQLHVISTQGS